MKKRNILLSIVVAVFGFIFLSLDVNAASYTYDFSGSAAAFGGNYNKFFAEDSLSYNELKYVKITFHANDGNKLKVSLLHTEDWLSTATVVASTDTLAAKDNNYTIYAIPENMTCPSDANYCLKMPASYSGSSNYIGYDFMTGIRFTNESWFFGTLYISGSYTLYY